MFVCALVDVLNAENQQLQRAAARAQVRRHLRSDLNNIPECIQSKQCALVDVHHGGVAINHQLGGIAAQMRSHLQCKLLAALHIRLGPAALPPEGKAVELRHPVAYRTI